LRNELSPKITLEAKKREITSIDLILHQGTGKDSAKTAYHNANDNGGNSHRILLNFDRSMSDSAQDKT
jgi:hypothetical protein